MSNIALNFICKNEGHIITRMLESVRPVVDIVVAVDTGSEDNTVALIKQFGQKYSIPTFVFERPFDNFCNSRNYALDSLIDVANQLQWDFKQSWGLSIDCDEMLVISDQFSREQITKDIYSVLTRDGEITFMRSSLFRLSTNCRWERPVHETIVWPDVSVEIGLLNHAFVECERKGASWKSDIEGKSLNYVRLLREYIDSGHTDFKTLYDTGRAFEGAAEHCKSAERRKGHRVSAKEYYERAMEMTDLPTEDKIAVYQRLAMIKVALHEEWADAQQLLVKAYALNMIKGESIADLVDFYKRKRRWNTAYLFSYFGVKNYNGNDPSGRVDGVVISPLYHWGFLLRHTICAYMSGRRTTARECREGLKEFLLANYQTFTTRELVEIQTSTLFNLFLKYWRHRLTFWKK